MEGTKRRSVWSTLWRVKNKYKSATNQEVKRTNHSYRANHRNKSLAIWQIINENIKKPSSQTEHIPSDPTEMNRYLTYVGSTLAGNVDGTKKMLVNISMSSPKSMFLEGTTAAEVISVVLSMHNRTTCDIYGMSVSLMRKIIDAIELPLGDIINLCSQQGVFPK
ncbi:hypothetical protein HHI36_001527 [Cryptolaemus montrouzieri]|uniref:Uncharacterized protein n=1 Tax=Cryptolaemus montrouzieri TaxID=559131 RepID=A0ABD2P7V9_9CUCU